MSIRPLHDRPSTGRRVKSLRIKHTVDFEDVEACVAIRLDHHNTTSNREAFIDDLPETAEEVETMVRDTLHLYGRLRLEDPFDGYRHKWAGEAHALIRRRLKNVVPRFYELANTEA